MDSENTPKTNAASGSRTSSNTARRQFFADAARLACGVSLLGLGLGLYARHATALPPVALRPPGALPESEFSAACIRCGMCVRDCPFNMLMLARVGEPLAVGTPYFVARQAPCEMCEDIPCIKACPTKALDHALTDITKAKMGLAVLVDQETCLNFLGLRCDICYRVCPVLDKAITLEPQSNTRTGRHTLFIPVVHSEHCTGCGLCEKACPTEIAAIKVLPLEMAKGQLSTHYRLGWIEKEKAGGSLVAPDVQHHYNLPEGLRYESGKGLSTLPPGESAPVVPEAPAGLPSGLPKALQGNKL
ncbi:MAG: ferredoxin-type protein NapG [Rhodocyclaceae bacterium]|jgi:ferredoxin-type protein NapG|nr:ferredoxin-type protein NapG [Rhodocyclaceae bacterium]